MQTSQTSQTLPDLPTPILPVPLPELDPEISPFHTQTVPIYCSRSGVTIGAFTTYIFEGRDAVVADWNSHTILHPFYSLHHQVLHKKLDNALEKAMEQGWDLPPFARLRIQLLVSAILYSLDCIKQDRPNLPEWKYAAGSADRILKFSKWYFEETSRRGNLPTYSISSLNSNLSWNNLSAFCDSLASVKAFWAKRVRELELSEQQAQAEIKATEVVHRAKLLKRIDLKKVWNWIELQLVDEIPKRDVDMYKELFLEGDLNCHVWKSQDLDDLVEAIVSYCDIGNDITVFINDRLNAIRTLIQEFCQGFTVIGNSSSSSLDSQAEQTTEEKAFIDDLDAKLDALGEMPVAPKREHFPSQALFFRAQAQFELLKKRYNVQQSRKS